MKRGRFRKDLYFRLNVMGVYVPPLRERLEDIAPLARNLLGTIALDLQLPLVPGIDEKNMAALRAYPWPGNVRELRNVLERAVIRSGGGPIDLTGLGVLPTDGLRESRMFEIPEGKGLNEILADFKKWMIDDSLNRTGGNKSQAARMLGISRLSVIQHIKRQS